MYAFIRSTYCTYYAAIQKRVLGIQSGFEYSRVSVLGMDFHSNRCSGRVWVLSSGFSFGYPNTPPDPNPTRCYP